jgi:DNA-binding CsgD family transcriptional regulator
MSAPDGFLYFAVHVTSDVQEYVMKDWQEALLDCIEDEQREQDIFTRIHGAAQALGFEYCAYGFRGPVPLSNPKTVLLNNYPGAWQQRYANAGYLLVDPTVLHGRRSQLPLVWHDDLFAGSRQLWDEARSFGLRHGWAQSSLDSVGVVGMLSLARSSDPITPAELEAHGQKMRWLVHVAHLSLARILKARRADQSTPNLTGRELEVLKWTADGKSSQDIADILTVSKNTVDFHVKNAVAKLQAANKTAAVVRAAMLGYLN